MYARRSELAVGRGFSRIEALGLAVAFEGSILVGALGLGWLFERPPLQLIGLSWSSAALGVGATAPLLLLFAWTQRSTLPRIEHLRREMTDLLGPLFDSCRPLDIAAISLLAGVGEELLFRGIVQTGIAEMAGVPAGLAAASVLFGLVHLVTPTYALLAGLVGAYLGGLFIASDNLLLPITVHSVYDFVALTFLLRQRSRGQAVEQSSGGRSID
jgi:membrane protease YdiL (CAAX protease family)